EQQKLNLLNKKIPPENIRNQIVSSLGQLKNNLKQILDEHAAHLIFFGIVALLDEEILSSTEWIPLQQEYFNTTHAGEIFYENLDEVLENPHISPFVLEVFYFILKKGFRGKYAKSQSRVAKYIDFLSEK